MVDIFVAGFLLINLHFFIGGSALTDSDQWSLTEESAGPGCPASWCKKHGYTEDVCGCGVCGSFGSCTWSCDPQLDKSQESGQYPLLSCKPKAWTVTLWLAFFVIIVVITIIVCLIINGRLHVLKEIQWSQKHNVTHKYDSSMPDNMFKFSADDPDGLEAFSSLQEVNSLLTHMNSSLKSLQERTDRYDRLKIDPEIRQLSAKQRRIPLREALDMEILNSFTCKLLAWICPPLLSVFCLIFRQMMLQVNMQNYVLYMDAFEKVLQQANHTAPTEDFNRIRNGTLWDTVSEIVAKKEWMDKHLDLSYFNFLSAAPAIMFVMMMLAPLHPKVGCASIAIWTKTFLVFSMLTLWEGIFDLVTSTPASTGWNHFKRGVGSGGLMILRKGNANFAAMLFDINFWHGLWQGLKTVVLGYARDAPYTGMFTTGHTSMTIVFSMGVNRMMKRIMMTSTDIIAFFVNCICVACVLFDIVVISITASHYSADLALGVLLAFLWYDSCHLESAVQWYVRGFHWRQTWVKSPTDLEEAGPWARHFFKHAAPWWLRPLTLPDACHQARDRCFAIVDKALRGSAGFQCFCWRLTQYVELKCFPQSSRDAVKAKQLKKRSDMQREWDARHQAEESIAPQSRQPSLKLIPLESSPHDKLYDIICDSESIAMIDLPRLRAARGMPDSKAPQY